jgi:hypothetical protein
MSKRRHPQPGGLRRRSAVGTTRQPPPRAATPVPSQQQGASAAVCAPGGRSAACELWRECSRWLAAYFGRDPTDPNLALQLSDERSFPVKFDYVLSRLTRSGHDGLIDRGSLSARLTSRRFR